MVNAYLNKAKSIMARNLNSYYLTTVQSIFSILRDFFSSGKFESVPMLSYSRNKITRTRIQILDIRLSKELQKFLNRNKNSINTTQVVVSNLI